MLSVKLVGNHNNCEKGNFDQKLNKNEPLTYGGKD